MSEAVLNQCEAWVAKHGALMAESAISMLLQETCQLSSSEVAFLREGFDASGASADRLQTVPLVPFVQWLFQALPPLPVPGPPRAPEQSGVPLHEFKRLVVENKPWLSTARWNPHTGRMERPNMYDVVAEIIKPRTKAKLVAYAELLEPLAPQVFVSHWWGEEFISFVQALRLFAKVFTIQAHPLALCEVTPEEHVAFWVCSFANRQWEVNLGNTLQESPFERALAAPTCTHVVMIMDPDATPLQRIWCLYEVLRTHALKKTFHIATENGVLTFGSDEPKGEQRNDLLRLTKRVLEIDASTAQASQEQDRRMIMQEIDQVTFEGRTMLHSTAQRKGPDEVRLALAAADPEELKSCNSLGQTPLHVAAAYNQHMDVLDLLLSAKMDANDELMFLSHARSLTIVAHENPRRARAAKERDKNFLTPWMLSAVTGHHEALAHLLARGGSLDHDVDLSERERLPWTTRPIPNALELSAFSGSVECCRILLDQPGQKVHLVMLTSASVFGHREVLEALLPHVEDLNCSASGPFPSPLLSASFCGHLDCVELLLKHKALPNVTADGGKTPFFCSMSTGYESVGRLLLSYRADPWITTDAEEHPLSVASGGGHDGCVRMLLSLRADLHGKHGESKSTALHVAAEWGREPTVRLLVENRADVNGKDMNEKTPLHRAAEYGYVEIIAALMGLRADPGHADCDGRTPLDVAKHEGMEEAAELLRILQQQV